MPGVEDYKKQIEDETGNPDEEFISRSESESDSEEDIKLPEPSKNAIYNKNGLQEMLEDIRWPDSVEWIQKLSIDVDQAQDVDVNDDLVRELFFYTQALEGSRMAFRKLESEGVPFLRPADYYAEMLKSDAHMEKVKTRLMVQKRSMEEMEERRKAREMKRRAKEIQAQRLKEKAAQKRAEMEDVKKMRKQRKEGELFEWSSGKGKGASFHGDRASVKGKLQRKPKREFKNKKFGFGGPKGLKKQNTAESTANFKTFDRDKAGNKRKKRQR